MENLVREKEKEENDRETNLKVSSVVSTHVPGEQHATQSLILVTRIVARHWGRWGHHRHGLKYHILLHIAMIYFFFIFRIMCRIKVIKSQEIAHLLNCEPFRCDGYLRGVGRTSVRIP